jgi:hypothetical protein
VTACEIEEAEVFSAFLGTIYNEELDALGVIFSGVAKQKLMVTKTIFKPHIRMGPRLFTYFPRRLK